MTGDVAQPLPDHADRDLRLPAWGPYGKRYAGVSHVADTDRGTRFDVAIVPALFRGAMVIPDALRPTGVHPWHAAPGLQFYTYRYELEWKDRLYCDVSFTALSGRERLITCEFVNNTDVAHRVVAHAVASLDFARIRSHRGWLRSARLEAPPSVHWVDALDYHELTFATPRRSAGLQPDGLFQGEQRAHGAVGGSVLGARFGAEGDRVGYPIDLAEPMRDAVVRMRYRLAADADVSVRLGGLVDATLSLTGSGRMETVDVGIGALTAGGHTLSVTSLGWATPGRLTCEIDGFVVGERDDVASVRFVEDSLDARAECRPVSATGGMIADYPALSHVYGMCWAGTETATTEFVGSDLDWLLRGAKYDAAGTPRPSSVGDPNQGSAVQFTDLLTRPMSLPAQATRTVHGLVCHGDEEEVVARLEAFIADGTSGHSRITAGAERLPELATNPAGERHVPAQQRMTATLLTNVVYPTYVRRGYVRHFAPGRWWDSLYTWDSGFIGLGLVEVDRERAEDCLNTYLTEPGDPHAAYIHHGSPVPVQQYLAAELFNRSSSAAQLAHWYPRLRQQYLFLAGHHPASRTRLPSGLLNTFDYFYNSGGWDDYPAQAYTHEHRLAPVVAPMVTAAQAIRVAKTLVLAASQVPGEGSGHVDGYLDDIARLTEAVQRCWDPDAGYFGYGLHEDGRLTGILRDEHGVNLNMGLDGVHPLVAGACTPDQQEALLHRLFSPHRLWTEIGISAVDQSAPYFSLDGYWNGSVWMAHQWFLFKTMLDLGHPGYARRIATTALNVWTSETDRTYNCWEHFSIATGRGAGWHQFSALSAPVLNFFAAYHRPGNLTTGLDTWTTSRSFNADHTELSAELISLPVASGRAALVACMAPGHRYQAYLDGAAIEAETAGDGVLHVTWPATADPGVRTHTLRVRRG